MKEILTDPKKGLSYFWSIICAIQISYILYRWGYKVEILTLIIGFISGGIMGGIMGVWFGGTTNKSHINPDGTTTTADIQLTQTTVDKPLDPVKTES